MSRERKTVVEESTTNDEVTKKSVEGKKKRSRGGNKASANKSGCSYPNDPGYYFTDQEFMKQMTSISFNQFTGVPFDLGISGATDSNVHIPSILKVLFNPSIGNVPREFARNKGINMAGFKLYTTLSSINAKTTNYAPHDLSIMLLAYGNVLAYKGFIERCFGLAFLSNMRSRAVPVKLIECMGIDYEDFTSNLAAYRTKYNTIITMLQSVPIPANIAYFHKCIGMFDRVFVDEDSSMAQLILPCPKYVWNIDEQESSAGTKLKAVDVSNPGTFNACLETFRTLVTTLLNSSTLNYIYADILNLARKENIPLNVVSIIPESYVVYPEYNDLYCTMVHNARAIGDPIAKSSVPSTLISLNEFSDGLDVEPDPNTNCLWQHPCFSRGTMGFDAKPIIDFSYDNPSMEEIVEATRMVSGCEAIPNSATGSAFFYSGFTPDWYVTTFVTYDDRGQQGLYYSVVNGNNIRVASTQLSKFRKCPVLLCVEGSTFHGIQGDLQYYTTVDNTYLDRINDAAMLALFELR